jgi:hypothetical protein
MVTLPKNAITVAGVCPHDASSILVRGEALNTIVPKTLTSDPDSGLVVTNDSKVVEVLSESLDAIPSARGPAQSTDLFVPIARAGVK